MMDAYCQRTKLTLEDLRFFFDGHRLQPEQTPKDLSKQKK